MKKTNKFYMVAFALFCLVGQVFAQDINIQNNSQDTAFLNLLHSTAKSITLSPEVEPSQGSIKVGNYALATGESEVEFAFTFGKSMDVLHTSIIRFVAGQLGAEIICNSMVENEIINDTTNQKEKLAVTCGSDGDISITVTPVS